MTVDPYRGHEWLTMSDGHESRTEKRGTRVETQHARTECPFSFLRSCHVMAPMLYILENAHKHFSRLEGP